MPDDLSRSIRRLDIPATPRLVLEFLLDCAVDPAALRFPNRETIVRELHFSERAVVYALRFLEDAKLIHTTNRHICRKRRKSWLLDIERIMSGRPESVPTIRRRTKPKGADVAPNSEGLLGATCDMNPAPELGATFAAPIDTESSYKEDSKADALERGACAPAAAPPPPPAPAPEIIVDNSRKASRWPAGQAVPYAWIDEGYDIRRDAGLPEINLDLEAANFTDHWTAKAGKDACKRDWHATWRQWVRNSHQKFPNSANGKPRTGFNAEILRKIEQARRAGAGKL